MTLIENDSPKVQYTGPFIKGQLLPLTFPYIATEDVKMIIDDTPAIFNVDYEIITEPNDEHPVAYPNSAYIKSDLPNAKQITLYRVTPLDQQAPFPQQSKFRSERVEQALDKLTMQQQEQEEQLSRCIIAPITLETFNGQLPEPAADQALKWNTDGTALENYDIIGEQEAFENDITTRFEEQSTAFENRVTQFEEETTTQFSEFRNEINENLETVLDAAEKLENLDNSVQAAENAASQATAAAARADEAMDEAGLAADQAEDALTEVKEFIQNAEHEISQYYSLPMFTPLWSDHILNDASYLRADTFSWHNGEIFVTAYNILLSEFNSDKCVEEVEGNVTYKRTPSGFKIADIAQHENVLTTFTMTGKSWFYVLDIEQQRFKLPRTQYSFTGIRDTVGGDVQAGLPSLSHTHTYSSTTGSAGKHGHNIYQWNQNNKNYDATQWNTAGTASTVAQFGAYHPASQLTWSSTTFKSAGGNDSFEGSGDISGTTNSIAAHTHSISGTTATNSSVNSVYGKSNTVQPPATQMYLYFFVGNYARPQSDIDIGEVFELINERDFEEQIAQGKNELNTTKNNCINEINSTGVGGRVLKTGDTMTGNLTIASTEDQAYRVQRTDIDYTQVPEGSADTLVLGSFRATDKNNKILGDIRFQRATTDGLQGTLMLARNAITGTEVSANIGVYVGATGNVWTSAPTPATGDNSTKIATTAYCVNRRCTTKATTTSSASITRPCWIVQNYLSGSSWYRVWSDGWIEQGGSISTSGAVAAKDVKTLVVTLLKNFTNATSIYAQAIPNAATYTSALTGRSTATLSFTFKNTNTNNSDSGLTTAYWYACGY